MLHAFKSYIFSIKSTPKVWAIKIISFLVFAVAFFIIFKPIKVLPRIKLAPGFLSQNHKGTFVSNDDYLGRIIIYNFGISDCESNCDNIFGEMNTIQRELSPVSPSDFMFQLVTISLDPTNDSISSRNDMMEIYSLENHISWDYLSNDPLTTKYILEGGFNLNYENFIISPSKMQEEIENYAHNFFLVDGWGIIRAEYNKENFSVTRLLTDIEILKKEIENSTGATKLVYEAAHLFGCYHD